MIKPIIENEMKNIFYSFDESIVLSCQTRTNKQKKSLKII